MRFASQSLRLSLAPHVRACEVDGQVVLLDLIRNRYHGVSGAMSTAIACRVDRWPKVSSSTPPAPEQAAPNELISQLVAQGLLFEGVGNTAKENAIDAPTASLDFGDITAPESIGVRRFAHFITGAAQATWWLRHRSLQAITLAVTQRREARAAPGLTGIADLVAMKRATVAYERLRPFLFTARDQCLFDSLALLSFLAAEQLFPRWVIGVKTGPFGAHSWIQAGTTVLNDQHEYVRRFRPILVI